MYTGTLIDDLIHTVQRAEIDAKNAEPQTEPGMIELRLFMTQMQHTQGLRHIRVGVA